MNQNEEVPESLGGLGDMLPADVLKMVNEVLEQMHRKDKDHQGSKIEIVYVASGGQHVENQIIFGAHPGPPQGREKGGQSLTESIKEDMPLSALFRDNHHEELRKVIESWRPYLIHDNTNTDALELVRFEFDKDRIYSNKVYRDLCELDVHGALQVSLSQLARYLASHSNLSRSYASLYQQLKYYRSEWS